MTERGARGAQGPSGGQGIEGPTGPTGPEGEIGPGGGRGPIGKRGERGRTLLPHQIVLSFAAVVLIAFLVLGFMGFQITQNRGLARQGKEAHDALCVFKGDLQRRANATTKYIRQVRSGQRIIVPGLTLAELDTSRANQQRAVDSLGNLECEPPTPERTTP